MRVRLKGPLKIVCGCVPNWVKVISVINNGEAFTATVSPLLSGGLEGAVYELTVEAQNSKVSVRESKISAILPAGCPERHINRDGSFCIGLDAGDDITDTTSAEAWWAALEDFLKAQQWAAKHRRWPPGRWLSHGYAAGDHLEMEKIAREMGWEEEVRRAIEYKEGWLAGPLPPHRKNFDMLVNQRSPCPRGCTRRKGRRILSMPRRKCAHKHQVSMLVRHERSRRKKEAEYVNELIGKGFTCCGSMNECPFKDQKGN